jgi:hypothetical protein
VALAHDRRRSVRRPQLPVGLVTSRWVAEVAPQRDLAVTCRSYGLELRDDYGVAPTVPEYYREAALAARAVPDGSSRCVLLTR